MTQRKWRRGLLIQDLHLPRVSRQLQTIIPNPVLPRILPVSSQNGVKSGLLSQKAQPATIWCNLCRVERCCGHQGRKDVERHISSDGHTKKTKDLWSNQQIRSFFPSAPWRARWGVLKWKWLQRSWSTTCPCFCWPLESPSERYFPRFRDSKGI